MSYLSEHYYKIMKLVPSSEGKNIALRAQYHKARVKDWYLDERNFIENWAKPAIQKAIDESIDEMIKKSLNDDLISIKLNVWK